MFVTKVVNGDYFISRKTVQFPNKETRLHVYFGRKRKERVEDLYLNPKTVTGQVINFGDID